MYTFVEGIFYPILQLTLTCITELVHFCWCFFKSRFSIHFFPHLEQQNFWPECCDWTESLCLFKSEFREKIVEQALHWNSIVEITRNASNTGFYKSSWPMISYYTKILKIVISAFHWPWPAKVFSPYKVKTLVAIWVASCATTVGPNIAYR